MNYYYILPVSIEIWPNIKVILEADLILHHLCIFEEIFLTVLHPHFSSWTAAASAYLSTSPCQASLPSLGGTPSTRWLDLRVVVIQCVWHTQAQAHTRSHTFTHHLGQVHHLPWPALPFPQPRMLMAWHSGQQPRLPHPGPGPRGRGQQLAVCRRSLEASTADESPRINI